MAALPLSCAESSPAEIRRNEPAPEARPDADVPRPESAVDECRSRLVERFGQEGVKRGTGGLREPPSQRAERLARGRSTPLLFERAPRATQGDPTVDYWRRRVLSASSRAEALVKHFREIVRWPRVARGFFLREGYFYIEDPSLAAAAVRRLRLDQLFDDAELVLQRGTEVFPLRLSEGRYLHVGDEDADKGERARLLLNDRVWVAGTDIGEPLHADPRALQAALGFDSLEIRAHVGSDWLAELSYGSAQSTAWLQAASGGRLELGCESIETSQRELLVASRALRQRRMRVVEALRAVVEEQVHEALPFDEPKTEEGQQDGKLRQEWRLAYNYGRQRYEFNGDEYRVFDWRGHPRVPQVCIDFVTDSLERLGGSWYRPRGEPRGRTAGVFHFSDPALENRRSVESFLQFAWGSPERFDVVFTEPAHQIPLYRRQRFFDSLYEDRHRYLPGDIVAIYGLRDDGKMHYHSFFVLESDPVTAMPMVVAANAGWPRIRTWEEEMLSAPKRKIHARVRPRLAWYESLLAGAGAAAARARARAAAAQAAGETAATSRSEPPDAPGAGST